MTGPTHDRSVADVLDERFAMLPAKQQAVARHLREDPAFVSYASAADLAERAGVDAATVVRTCQALGYTGWRQLQEEVRHGLWARGTFADRVAALREPEDGDLVGRVFATAIDNVSATFAELDRAAFQAAVSCVARAGTVLVVGGGVAHGPGVFLASSLQLLGCRAIAVTTAPEAGPAWGSLVEGDAVVGISAWRYLRSTTKTLELTRDAGLRTVAITDSAVSSAALTADHVLVARTATVGPRLGLSGIMALLEAFITAVAVVDPDRAIAAVRRADALYSAAGVLERSEPPPSRRSVR